MKRMEKMKRMENMNDAKKPRTSDESRLLTSPEDYQGSCYELHTSAWLDIYKAAFTATYMGLREGCGTARALRTAASRAAREAHVAADEAMKRLRVWDDE